MSKSKQKLELIMTQFPQFEPEHRFHPDRKWRFDWAWPDAKIAIEYEGLIAARSRHRTIKGYHNDTEKYNAAVLLGWRVLRFTPISMKQPGIVLDQIRKLTCKCLENL